MIKRIQFALVAFLIGTMFVLPINSSIALAETQKSMTILFTNDMHDHLLPVKDEQNGMINQSGGFARLQSAIAAEKENDPDTLLLDAGDYSMGTPFQTIFRTDSPELSVMGQMGYDVVTLGNHEYDYRASGLADSLQAAVAARKNGGILPRIVQANVAFPAKEDGSLTPSLAALQQAYQDYGITEYTVIEKNGVKIGIFGLIGNDAASNAPKAEVEFTDPVANAERIVSVLKNQEKVDLIVCLSHSGTWEKASESEDQILAKKVPDIDVIISGHTHTKLEEPIIEGKTLICSAGDSCKYLGVLQISQKSGSSDWGLVACRLPAIDESLPEDLRIASIVSQFKQQVQDKFFAPFQLNYDQILAESPYNFRKVNDILNMHQEDPLANLISDAYVYAVKKAEGSGYVPVDVAVVPAGTIRGTFFKGAITAADAFSVSSLGIGPDNIPGYPLVSVYLTGQELKTLCEVDASISPMMAEAQLFMSGINFTYNPNRMIFNKVTDAVLQKPEGSIEEIDDTQLYRVVAGLYSAQMLSIVGDKSYGLLSIVPKTEEGTPVTDFEAQIVKDTAGNNAEVKEWQALAIYLQSFAKVGGVPTISDDYGMILGRKVVDNSHHPISVLANPNKITLTVYTVVLVIITLIIFAIYRIVTRRRRLARINQKSV
ncbi:MAG: bifunctional metallophosphatase/5'-nucleotidase [Dehalobacter sp. 4CP]|uniref:bifunctional metallophosphatase/5'-nucleotidase n=1 Tax=Dehalobacter sp. CP TaxID=2594474 RepID=UPI0013C8C277|nr:bifunctional metallophosphatase/5'-nucleotidase [Dehalobacter sp. 4CP]